MKASGTEKNNKNKIPLQLAPSIELPSAKSTERKILKNEQQEEEELKMAQNSRSKDDDQNEMRMTMRVDEGFQND